MVFVSVLYEPIYKPTCMDVLVPCTDITCQRCIPITSSNLNTVHKLCSFRSLLSVQILGPFVFCICNCISKFLAPGHILRIFGLLVSSRGSGDSKSSRGGPGAGPSL